MSVKFVFKVVYSLDFLSLYSFLNSKLNVTLTVISLVSAAVVGLITDDDGVGFCVGDDLIPEVWFCETESELEFEPTDVIFVEDEAVEVSEADGAGDGDTEAVEFEAGDVVCDEVGVGFGFADAETVALGDAEVDGLVTDEFPDVVTVAFAEEFEVDVGIADAETVELGDAEVDGLVADEFPDDDTVAFAEEFGDTEIGGVVTDEFPDSVTVAFGEAEMVAIVFEEVFKDVDDVGDGFSDNVAFGVEEMVFIASEEVFEEAVGEVGFNDGVALRELELDFTSVEFTDGGVAVAFGEMVELLMVVLLATVDDGVAVLFEADAMILVELL